VYEFDCPQPVALSLRIAGGGAEIVAEERQTATVEVTPFDGSDASREAAERTRVELRDGTLVIEAPEWTGWLFRRGPRVRVTARVPQDGDLTVKVASADVKAVGRYASANVGSASGDVFVDQASGDAVANTASGDLRFGRVDGELRLNAASGDISVGQVGGDTSAHSASGDVSIDRADASVKATTASGDVRIGVASAGIMKINTASGDVTIGVVPGTGVWLDLTTMSGDTHTDLAMPEGGGGDQASATLSLVVRTASGDIDVHRTTAAAPA
jgi:DUF4097 and DUF4098 domain-containing protein YvlB